MGRISVCLLLGRLLLNTFTRFHVGLYNINTYIFYYNKQWRRSQSVRPWPDKNFSDSIQMTPSIVLRTMKFIV